MFQGDNWTNIGFFGGSQKFDVGRKINLSKNNKGSFSSHAGYKAMSGIRGRNMQRYVRKNGGERHITKLPALSNGQHRFWGFKQHPSRTSVSKYILSSLTIENSTFFPSHSTTTFDIS